jgi:release factor glutamine methyltransferase
MSTAAQLLRETALAAVDARVLLCHALGWSAARLAAHADQPLPPQIVEAFSALAARRLHGEPVAYITGEREFYSLDFKVSPAVLIPRPETELLVELALARLPVDKRCRVLDLGTGSGCVALAIAAQRPLVQVTAVDSSRDALDLASANARALGVPEVEFRLGDWFSTLDARKFDLIVSNPPYIPAEDPHLRAGDLRFEPHGALVGGADGLDCIRAIVRGAPPHIVSGGWLLLEHGYDQSERCRELLQAAGFEAMFSQPDLAGMERVSGGRVT